MVEVMKYAERMWCIHVEVRVVCSGFIVFCIPPHFGKGIGAGGVIIHHVEDYGDAAFVTLIDKLFIHQVGAVCLVEGEIECRIIAPAVVPVELLYRHQFNSVYAEIFQIVQFLNGSVNISLFCKISQQQFVNNQIIGCRSFKVCNLPVISIGLDFENRNYSVPFCRVGFVVGVGGGGDIWIV
ncbi:hypothetical protein SDC9_100465 [bioreactor metagenome]|uniref:Uncharacterized protein n=1 Tax=bioreactor metagenome TaxID=1076179 RepID=A0A645AL93_9ZZZZ